MKFRLVADVIKDLMKLKVSNMKPSLIIGRGKVSTKSLFNG